MDWPCRRMPVVKAWSANGRVDINAEDGPADLIKGRMVKNIDYVEKQLALPVDPAQGAAAPPPADMVDQGPIWDELSNPLYAPVMPPPPTSTYEGMDYREGQYLLTSHWDQHYPYNEQCPWMNCGNGFPNGRAVVGCVATAGVQIFRYWSWPPCNAAGDYVDAYTWSNMPNIITGASPQSQIDCVAGACWSVGHSVGMEYGCSGSSAATDDMEDVFSNRRIFAGVAYRDDFNDIQWYERFYWQINLNQPVQYRVDEHSIVGDGCYTEVVGGSTVKWYHFNYGWGSGADLWYQFDQYPHGAGDEEYMVRFLKPDVSLDDTLSGVYTRHILTVNHFDKPTRYFNRDCTGTNAAFDVGQSLQYLRPGLWIKNTGTDGSAIIAFYGMPTLETEFYHKAPYGDKRIRILDGQIRLFAGGEMRLR